MAPPLYPLAGASMLTRRSFLTGSLSFAAAALLSNRIVGRIAEEPLFAGYPFTLGVASGEPEPDGMVLWTRLAPRPHEPDGGMFAEPVSVGWEVAEDESFTRITQQGTTTALPVWGHSVHVEVTGLRPNRWYWYRFHAGGELSPTGRTRTAPAAGATVERLRFAFASCQKYEMGYYTAYEHMAREDLDLVLHLGDYIYEKIDNGAAVRPHGLPVANSLDAYRQRYAVYKSDPALQAAHAMAPWIVTWDDHEVRNDYAADISDDPESEPPAAFLLRRAAAYQAYFEHMPLRRRSLPSGPEMLLYRRVEFGRLASFHVLDTRQYRSDQVEDDRPPTDPAVLDPLRTLLGARQRQWLDEGLDGSAAGWNVLAQQVMMARVDFKAGPDEEISMDKWAGYEAERRRLLRRFRDRRAVNPVVLTGDVHSNWANELSPDPDRLDEPPVAVEFVGTSISSSGDGAERAERFAELQGENPFVKFFNGERGYVRCEVTPQAWRTDYRTVPFITRPRAPLQTRASFVVESGRPALQRV
jgi:alkaline phosphatase D